MSHNTAGPLPPKIKPADVLPHTMEYDTIERQEPDLRDAKP